LELGDAERELPPLPDPERAPLDPEAPPEREPLAPERPDPDPLEAEVAAPPEELIDGTSAFVGSAFAGSVLDDSDSDEDAALEGSSASEPARFRRFSLSPLKSVSYQPAPFRRKFGAETSFFRAFFPQEGHFSRGASVIFCITSV
jgi:hypothetical protein